jgi:acetyl-CoA carboxylase alpha subunit
VYASRFTHHASRFTLLLLICHDQPGAAVAAIYAKLRCHSQLGARRAMKRVHVPAVCIIPEMIFDQNLDPDLSLRHAIIIND